METVRSRPIGIPRIGYILGLLIALVVSDGLITDFLVGSGVGRELNPLLHDLVGEGNFLLLKVAGALLSAIILWQMHKRRPNLVLTSSLFFVVLYTGIVYWNVAAFFITQV
jgi:hypothetical protein